MLSAVGCARRPPPVTATVIRGPDGTDNWVAIECQSAQLACTAEAGRVCPNGYDTAGEMGHEGQASSSTAYANGYGGFAVSRSQTTYAGEMLIHCHGAPVVGPGGTAEAPPPPRRCFDDNDCRVGEQCETAPGERKGVCTPDTK